MHKIVIQIDTTAKAFYVLGDDKEIPGVDEVILSATKDKALSVEVGVKGEKTQLVPKEVYGDIVVEPLPKKAVKAKEAPAVEAKEVPKE